MIELMCGINRKMMAMVMGSLLYGNDRYIIYCIDRGNGEANIFVSKLVISSEGYTFNHEFDNGEKEMLDGVIKRIINKEDIKSNGFELSKDIKLADVNRFDIEECYVATINKRVVKEVMIHYDLMKEEMFDKPVVDVVDDKRVFNDGFVGNVFLILFGLAVVIFCVVVVLGVF